MERNKSLAYNFGFEAMPLLFHSQTSAFIKYLENDGKKFLDFWWNHVGDQLEESKRVPPGGLTFSMDQYDDKTKIVIITLPSAREDGDPIFLGAVARPERRFSFVRIPNTELYILSRYDGCAAQHKTAFGELSPRAIYREIGVGLNPNKIDFKRYIKERLDKKNKSKKKSENKK